MPRICPYSSLPEVSPSLLRSHDMYAHHVPPSLAGKDCRRRLHQDAWLEGGDSTERVSQGIRRRKPRRACYLWYVSCLGSVALQTWHISDVVAQNTRKRPSALEMMTQIGTSWSTICGGPCRASGLSSISPCFSSRRYVVYGFRSTSSYY